MKTIVYIDGQNFLYKVAERLFQANLVSDKQDIYSLDIMGLVGPLFPNDKLEVRYYGVKRIYHGRDLSADEEAKAERFSDSLRRLKNYLHKNGVVYIPKGSLKMRASEGCRNCGFVEHRFQEKGVDVGIAVDLVQDAVAKKCDRIALLSSDTDLLPALQAVKKERIPISYISFANQATVSLVKISSTHVTLKDKDVVEAYIRSVN